MNEWERPAERRRTQGVVALVAAIVVAAAGVMLLRSPTPTGELEISQELVPPVVETEPTAWASPEPGTWRRVPPAPLTSRVNYTMAWTGREMVVWGGFDAVNRPLVDGAAFDPASGMWRTLPFTAARDAAAAGVVAGTDVVFVSGADTRRYDPIANRWRGAPLLPVPARHTLGNHVLAAGRSVIAVTEPFDRTQPAAMFVLRPGADWWERLPDVPVTLTRAHAVLTAGDDVLIMGSPVDDQPAAVAIRIETVPPTRRGIAAPPQSGVAPGTWRHIEAPPQLDQQDLIALTGAARGDDLMVFGVRNDRREGYAAVRQDGAWRLVDPGPLRPANAVIVLAAGERLVVWDRLTNTGALFDPAIDRWQDVPRPPITGLDLARDAVWTGSELLAWGALGTGGALYTPP